MESFHRSLDFDQALHCLVGGGTLLYPTETFYALGCSFRNKKAIRRIKEIKNRLQTKPFPLIAGNMKQVRQHVHLTPEIEQLVEQFWPGPLSVLVRSRTDITQELRDKRGFTSIRLSPHPVAQALCLESDQLLVATSANFAGNQPAAFPEQIDSELKKEVDCCFLGTPFPAGGLPSTLVYFEEKKLHILREGALSAKEILSFYTKG